MPRTSHTEQPLTGADDCAIDVFGSASGASGWSTHAVEFARALRRLAPVNFRDKSMTVLGALSRPGEARMYLRGRWQRPGCFGVVVTGEPFREQPSTRWIVWETTALPDRVREQCAATPYVWTPSTWGFRNLLSNGIPAEKLALVPEGVDVSYYRPASRKDTGPFVFLFVGKWETRKFLDGLVRAFTTEFKPSENVELILHAHNSYAPGFSTTTELAKLGVSAGARIRVSELGPRDALRRLYQSADCFVCPTRAEGWGLPILEAMACGVPAIVTRYSAPVDFVSDDNGYLLDYRLVDAHCDWFNIHTGQWAEPDESHLRALMRLAVQDEDGRRRRGLQARRDAERWSWSNAAAVAVRAIRSHLKH